VYLAFTNALAAGFGFPLLFEVWSDSAMAGVVVLWLASLYALGFKRSVDETSSHPSPQPSPLTGRGVA
jgi:hypothetical protein